MTIPIVAGGSHLRLHLAVANPPGNADTLDLLVDGEVIDSWRVPELFGWQDHTLGPWPWPEGGVLSLRARTAGTEIKRGRGVLVDRLELDWLDSP